MTKIRTGSVKVTGLLKRRSDGSFSGMPAAGFYGILVYLTKGICIVKIRVSVYASHMNGG